MRRKAAADTCLSPGPNCGRQKYDSFGSLPTMKSVTCG